MKREDFAANIGKEVYVSNAGDQWMDVGIRPVLQIPGEPISEAPRSILVRLTKAGLAVVALEGKEYRVRPRNVSLAPVGVLTATASD